MFVLISHSSGWLPSFIATLRLGNVGVFSFFLLSGFVITEALDLFYRGAARRFLTNRLLKLGPAYWSAVIVAYAIFAFLDRPELRLDAWAIIVNFSLLLGFLKSGNNLNLLSLAWAVLVEVQFYVLVALIFTTATRLRAGGAFIACCGVIALALYVFVFQTHAEQRFFGVFRFAPYFVCGAAYYYGITRRHPIAWLITTIALVFSLHAFWTYGTGLGQVDPTHSTVAFVVMMVIFAGLAHLWTSDARERVDKRLGDLTYALYLVHTPVVLLVESWNFSNPSSVVAVVTLSFVLTISIYAFVERPVTRLRDRVRGVRLYA